MTTFRTLLLALVILLSASTISFSAQQSHVEKVKQTLTQAYFEEYVYIKGILYHIIYDDYGNIILRDEIED